MIWFGVSTREDRARLHEKYAAWLQTTTAAPPDIHELVAHHLAQAVQHRRAIGAI